MVPALTAPTGQPWQQPCERGAGERVHGSDNSTEGAIAQTEVKQTVDNESAK